MSTDDSRDRLIDSLLSEIVGGDRPPDLREEILRRTAGGRRAWRWLTLGTAAAVLLGVGVWIVLEPSSRTPERPGPASAVPNPEETVTEPLPPEIHDFKGLLEGTIVSVDAEGLVLKVSKASALPGNKAPDPRWLEGRKARLLFMRFGNEVSPELLREAGKLKGQDGPVTADAWGERGEALIVTRLRAGAHADPEDR
ncbi:MAG TPA: hypothetical protein VJB14_07270 [Planctomycetota bacterium]|nr:hypothetical protein [Planctomycetota bacterium]